MVTTMILRSYSYTVTRHKYHRNAYVWLLNGIITTLFTMVTKYNSININQNHIDMYSN